MELDKGGIVAETGMTLDLKTPADKARLRIQVKIPCYRELGRGMTCEVGE